MCTRNVGIILAAMVLLMASGMAYHTLATAASKKGASAPASLSQAYLRGSMQGHSGIALDLNGDGNDDLVVGAPYAKHKNKHKSKYKSTHKHTTGALLVYLSTHRGFRNRPSAVLRGEGILGWSLVALGDVDDDRKSDFAAGAVNGSGENVSLSGTVAVYKGGRKPQKVAVLEGDNAMDNFGYALASGDLNNDGSPDLIVGAPMHSPSPDLYQQGAVYVYFGPDYAPADAMKIPATAANGGIGFSLATGDINDDGVDDLLMGASGKVIGYFGGDSFPSEEGPEVVFESGDRRFGRSIAVLWDVDGKGCNDVAVGAHEAAVGDDRYNGRLYILGGGPSLGDGLSSLDLLATIDGKEKSGQFASAILPLGDVNGDHIPDLAVSAEHADGNPWTMTGKIFIFDGSTLTEEPAETIRAIPGEARDMHLGSFLALVDGNWLAAGARTEKANTGSVRLYDLAQPAMDDNRGMKGKEGCP